MQTSAMPASMRSLAFKLTLAFLAVGIIAVALVAGLISFRTESEISRLVYDRNVVALTDVLANHYARSGSWDDAGMIFERGHATATTSATQFDWRQYSVALLANDGQVIYGRGEFTAGQYSAGANRAAHPSHQGRWQGGRAPAGEQHRRCWHRRCWHRSVSPRRTSAG